ncbi:MAG: Ig-like domain-containing protein [candidate division Zixibacteria bacterium]|nr:Ig-like domain-containing protein [candidate division Zixibacteria bacterium]
MIPSIRFMFTVCVMSWFVLVSCGKDSSTRPPAPETPSVPARITITPASNEFTALGQTVQLSATVFDSNNQRITDATVSWSSSDPAVVTVSAQGMITSVKNGTARITASVGGISASAEIVVSQVAFKVTIVPPSALLTAIGQTLELTAVVHDFNGQIVEDAVATWHSDKPDVVTVDDEGMITAVKNGTAAITATVSGPRWALIRITVSDPGVDRKILVDLYNELDGPNWWWDDNWLSDKPLSEWLGISTDQTGRVIRMDLGVMILRGMIPPELGDLTRLTYLSVVGNQLFGPIPPELGNLGRLIHLDLDDNGLSGQIPPEFGNLINLQYLLFSDNPDLTGPLPEEMTRLTNLKVLDLWGTSLCVPPDDVFQTWLEGIGTKHGIVTCSSQ